MIQAGPRYLDLPFGAGEVGYYRSCLAAALVVAGGLAVWSWRQDGVRGRQAAFVLGAAVLAFLVGARLANILLRPDFYLSQPWRAVALEAEGFSLYGGLAAAAAAAWVVARRLKLDGLRFADAAAPAFGVGLVVMRLGCFLNGCCFGRPTGLPWAVEYPLFSQAHLAQMSQGLTGPFAVLPVHPTQLYEGAAALAGSGLAVWLRKRQAPRGVPAAGFLLGLTVFRLANHSLRVLPYPRFAVEFAYPALYLAVIAACAVFIARSVRRDRATIVR